MRWTHSTWDPWRILRARGQEGTAGPVHSGQTLTYSAGLTEPRGWPSQALVRLPAPRLRRPVCSASLPVGCHHSRSEGASQGPDRFTDDSTTITRETPALEGLGAGRALATPHTVRSPCAAQTRWWRRCWVSTPLAPSHGSSVLTVLWSGRQPSSWGPARVSRVHSSCWPEHASPGAPGSFGCPLALPVELAEPACLSPGGGLRLFSGGLVRCQLPQP